MPTVPTASKDRHRLECTPPLCSPFVIGLLAGLAARPVVCAARDVAMGCFSSKMEASVKPVAARTAAPAVQSVPVGVASHPEAASIAVATPSSGVRRENPVTDLDRATLSLKSRRDKMEQQLAAAQEQCDADLRKAVEAKKEGRMEWAVFVMKRRRVVQRRAAAAMQSITQCETMLSTVGAAQNLQLIQKAMQESTSALQEFSKVCNADTVRAANDDWREQEEQVKEVEDALNEAGEDDEFDMPTMEELDAEIAAYEEKNGVPSSGGVFGSEADGGSAPEVTGGNLEGEERVTDYEEKDEEMMEEDASSSEQLAEKWSKAKAKTKVREPVLA